MIDLKKIYEKYFIPQNLQLHMRRVGALSEIITGAWIGSAIDKKAITEACLLHDIAKPMNFDLNGQAQYGMSNEDIEALKKLQSDLKTNYGTNEHDVSVKICEELGFSQKVVEIVGNVEWSYIPNLLQKKDHESLIAVYSDMRIGPKGLLTVKQRLEELKVRTGKGEFEKLGQQLEEYLKPKVSIDLNLIDRRAIEENSGKF